MFSNLLSRAKSLYHLILIIVSAVIFHVAQSAVDLPMDFKSFLISLSATMFSVSFILGLRQFLSIDELSLAIQKVRDDRVEGSHSCGIAKTFKSTDSFGNQKKWVSSLKEASSSVDLMGRALHHWTASEAARD